MLTMSRKLDECIEKIEKQKVMSHKTSNLLKDMEYDEKVLKEEICKSLVEEDDIRINE